MSRDLKKLRKRFNVEMITTKEAIKLGATTHFLHHVTTSKIPVDFNCYEEHLYDKKLMLKELAIWLKSKK